MSKIAVYGKGGVGKSTIASNLSVAFAQLGERVLQVGCDPKHDSCSKLIGNYKAPTILDVVSGRNDNDVVIDDFMTTGYAGVLCVESGGPRAGEGCAGRGIARAFELLTAKGMLGSDFVDHVIFDVLGDVVCGGFAYPLRMGFSESVVVVISDDPMSIYAANNICHAISRNADNGVRLAGFVINRSCNIDPLTETSGLAVKFAKKLSVPALAFVPDSPDFREAERRNATIFQAFGDNHPLSLIFTSLAKKLSNNEWSSKQVMAPMTDEELNDFLQQL